MKLLALAALSVASCQEPYSMAKLTWTDTGGDFNSLLVGANDGFDPEEYKTNSTESDNGKEEEQELILYRLDTGDSGFLNNVFFYGNILWYLIYCSFVATA